MTRFMRSLFVAFVLATISSHAGAADKVTVTLRSVARLEGKVIRVADIAELSGGSDSQRKRIAALDVEDAPQAGEEVEITPRQIAIRLRLAGIAAHQATVNGSTVCVGSGAHDATTRSTREPSRPIADANSILRTNSAVASKSRSASDARSDSLGETVLEREVIAAIQQCILARLPWPEDDVTIQLAQPLSRELRQVESLEVTNVTAELRSPGAPVGRVSVKVVVTTSEQKPLEVPVVLDVKHHDNVILVVKGIQRGQIITAPDLFVDRQDVTGLASYSSSSEEIVGRRAKRSIGPLQLIRTTDVESESASSTSSTVIVKRRDRLKVTAKVGVLAVTVTGEALQDGRIGEVISVKNVDSNSTLRGRVVSATEVEVQE